jgi:uncharacterized coiled-coil protein SlyX
MVISGGLFHCFGIASLLYEGREVRGIVTALNGALAAGMERNGIDTNPAIEARLDELEARLALQDQSIVELSDEIYAQQKDIARLEGKVRELTERLRAATAQDPAGDVSHEIPPHY